MRYLLDLLDTELSQPATELYPHNLAGILKTAIRYILDTGITSQLSNDVLSQRPFLKRQLTKDIFLCDNFPNVQFPKRQLPKSAIATALGPLACYSSGARSLYPILAAALGTIAVCGASAGLT